VANRINDIAVERDRAAKMMNAHTDAVTQALLENRKPPTDAPAALADATGALVLLRAAQTKADKVTADARGDLRAAIARALVERRSGAVEQVRAATRALHVAIVTAHAYDHLLRPAAVAAIPSLFHSRLSVPALPGDVELSSGLALDGRAVQSGSAITKRAHELRLECEGAFGLPIPF
jgi:hypothetical protein